MRVPQRWIQSEVKFKSSFSYRFIICNNFDFYFPTYFVMNTNLNRILSKETRRSKAFNTKKNEIKNKRKLVQKIY